MQGRGTLAALDSDREGRDTARLGRTQESKPKRSRRRVTSDWKAQAQGMLRCDFGVGTQAVIRVIFVFAILTVTALL